MADDQTLPSGQYMLPQAEDYRRKMAFELMYGKGQEPKDNMTHWSQLLGNVANRGAGNAMFNNANEFGRKSDLHDSSQFEKGMRPPISGMGGAAPFQASGPASGGPGGLPFNGGSPGMPPAPQTPPPGSVSPMPQPRPPGMQGMTPGQGMQFPGIGGLPEPGGWPQPPQQAGWPASLFNPQG